MVDIREEELGVGDDYPDAEYPNGTAPDDEDIADWRAIWNAPNYASMVKTPQSRRAKEYTGKLNSVVKGLTFASLQANDLPDAAALLHHGPPWTHAMGLLADKDRRVAATIDMLTSPNSPPVMAAVTTITLLAQLARNHEAQIREIPNTRKRAKAIKKSQKADDKVTPPRFTIKAFGRQWPIRFRSRFKVSTLFAGVRAQTYEPQLLTMQVFGDPVLLREFEKQGIRLVSDAPPQ